MIVNAWNEWDPLKRVIVGCPDGTMLPAPGPPDLITTPFGDKRGDTAWGPLPEEAVCLASEKVEAFVAELEGRGVIVDRPTPIDFSQRVETPEWKHDSMFGCMSPRDVLVTVGNEILEATMSTRARWHEYLCYRPLLEQYFKYDPNFAWETAPKPRLRDESYVKSYWYYYRNLWSTAQKHQRMLNREWWLSDTEPLFDAADICRFGKDLFIQPSGVTNAAGLNWLKRHLIPKGFRIHEVAFDGCLTPWHIDTIILPLRPGFMLQNPDQLPLDPRFHELLHINDWDVVHSARPTRTEKHPLSSCGLWLSQNALSLDPKTVCVEAAEVGISDQLDKLGFEVIPIDFFAVSPFGGGLHCATVDIFREGDCEDYFPKQIPGF